jgi:hypothetical protein
MIEWRAVLHLMLVLTQPIVTQSQNSRSVVVSIFYLRETTKFQLNPEYEQNPTTHKADPTIPANEMVMQT